MAKLRLFGPSAVVCVCAVASSGYGQGITSSALAQAVIRQTVPTVTVVPYDVSISERWRRPATVAVRRSTTSGSLSVNLYLAGTASKGSDYTTPFNGTVTFPNGVAEVYIEFTPRLDMRVEPEETINVQLASGTGYTVVSPSAATLKVLDSNSGPSEEEAVRFLYQAGFGADKATVQEVMSMDFEYWLKNQFLRPKGYLQPYISTKDPNTVQYTDPQIGLWSRMMRDKNLASNPQVLPDPLRLRVAYSLMQIFVISQRVDIILVNPEGVAHYFDRMMDGAFGSYRSLLSDVTLHPCMGCYLNHLGNRKANPEQNYYPDENYAREVMQLFSIGLWQLNPDGTKVLVNGQPVPTYNNHDISEFAKVFTGLTFGGPRNTEFYWPGWDFTHPMKGYDIEHDLGPKTLLRGVTLPARTASNPDTGAATMADVKGALDCLFYHPNVGPFIGRQLIQRMVTSNPSPGYISRVAAAFNNNGAGVRGDMKAVIRAILLDPEAREYEYTVDPKFGKKREPYMTLMSLGRTYDAKPQSGKYDSVQWMYDYFLQEPFLSPSVFNFYRPDYRPSGEMAVNGLFGPEFQIMTATTGLDCMNMLKHAVEYDISIWSPDPPDQIKLNLSVETAAAYDPDLLVRTIASRLTGRGLSPRTFQIIRNSVARIQTSGATWRTDRVNMAMYLVLSTPEFHILK